MTSKKDGYTEWVLPEHADMFHRDGIAVLGKHTESGEDRAAKAEDRAAKAEVELARMRSVDGAAAAAAAADAGQGECGSTNDSSKSKACMVS